MLLSTDLQFRLTFPIVALIARRPTDAIHRGLATNATYSPCPKKQKCCTGQASKLTPPRIPRLHGADYRPKAAFEGTLRLRNRTKPFLSTRMCFIPRTYIPEAINHPRQECIQTYPRYDAISSFCLPMVHGVVSGATVKELEWNEMTSRGQLERGVILPLHFCGAAI